MANFWSSVAATGGEGPQGKMEMGVGGLPNVRYMGMCHLPGWIFHFRKNPEQVANLKFFSKTGPDF